jgi:hypothetical protein
MFLPAFEPARSEALAQFLKTHHVPRHLVKGISRTDPGEHEPAVSVVAQPNPQRVPSQGIQASTAPE